MSTTTESPFSLTVKVGRNNDLLTGRADTVEEMLVRVQQLKQIAASMQDVAHVADPVEQAVATLAAGGITGTVVAGELETVTDKWGNEWTYNHPEAPDLPDGRGKYARKKGVGKTGKAYAGWFDPAKGPKPFPKGSVEAETIWPQR